MKMSTHITSLLLAAEALFSCKATPETPTLPYEADPVLRTPAQLRSDALPVAPPGGAPPPLTRRSLVHGAF